MVQLRVHAKPCSAVPGRPGSRSFASLGCGRPLSLVQARRGLWSPLRTARLRAAAADAAAGSDAAPPAQQAATAAAEASGEEQQQDWAPADEQAAVAEAGEALSGRAAQAAEREVQAYQEAPSGPLQQARDLFDGNRAVRGGVYAAAVFLGGTFLIALLRVAKKYNSTKAKRSRTVNKNKMLVEGVQELLALPAGRAALTPAALKDLRGKTGFTAEEVFRKYLWFMLRERPFDTDAVADAVALRQALALSDEQVAEALRERAARVYAKYGTVMLDTEGMTKAGIERKATSRGLFSKMLYLAELEELLPQESEAAKGVNLRDIFGATEDDAAKLRIVSLYEVDLGKLEDMPTTTEGGAEQA